MNITLRKWLSFSLLIVFIAWAIFPVWYRAANQESVHQALQAAGFVLLLAYILWRAMSGQARLPRTGLEAPLVLLGLAVAAGWLFSGHPRMGLPVVVSYLHYGLLYMVLLDAFDACLERSWLWAGFLTITGLLLGMAALETYARYWAWQQQVGGWSPLPPFPYRFKSLLTHANPFMALVNLAAPLAVAWLPAARTRAQRALLVSWLVLYGIAAPFSSSRGGWLGMAAWIGALGGLWLLGSSYWTRIWSWVRRRRWLALAGAGAALLTLAAAGYYFFIVFAAHPTHGTNPFGGRTDIWLNALQVWRRSPWVGVGPGNFILEYLRTGVSIPPQWYAPHAHNIFLQVMVEYGLLGLAAFVALLGALARRLWAAYRGAELADRPLLRAALAGLVAWLVQCLVDDMTVWAAVTYPLVFVLAAAGAPPGGPLLRWNRARLAILAAPLLLVGGFTAWSAWSAAPARQAIAQAAAGDFAAAAEGFLLSRERDPHLGYYTEMAALSRAAEWGAGARHAALDEAIALFDAAMDVAANGAEDPGTPVGPYPALWLADQAVLEAAAGQGQEATRHFEQAMQLAPLEASFPLNLGALREAQGEDQAAADLYCQALALEPGWAWHPFWSQTALRAAALQRCALPAGETQERATYTEQARQAARAGDLGTAQLRLAQADWAGEPALHRLVARGLTLWSAGERDQAADLFAQLAAQINPPSLRYNRYGWTFIRNYALLVGRPETFYDVVPGYRQLQEDFGQLEALGLLEAHYRQAGDEARADWVRDQRLLAEQGLSVVATPAE